MIVSAFYYSKFEKEAILKILKPITVTESYILGDLEPFEIAELRKQKILIDLHVDPTKKNRELPEILSRSVQNINNIKLEKLKSLKKFQGDNNYYVMRIAGPLLSDWKAALEAENILILESLEPNIYKIETKNPERLADFNFIDGYRQFNLYDKDIVLEKSRSFVLDPFAPIAIVVGKYDVRIHEAASIDALLNKLEDDNIPILEIGKNQVLVNIKDEQELLQIGQWEEVYGIEKYVEPKLHNDIAREILKIDIKGDTISINGNTLDGDGELVGVADTGLDKNHPDLQSGIKEIKCWGRPDDGSDPNGHGTHVSGSIIGDGSASDGKIKGIAPKAKLFFQSLLDSEGGIGGIPYDLSELFEEAYKAGVRVHNNSWGSATESEYRFNSLEVDDFIYNHKDMLLVISGGNEGTAFKPRNSETGHVDWLSLGSPATAKNALCVGASRSSRVSGGFSKLTYGQMWPQKYPDSPIKDDQVSGDSEAIAGFSSRGPCGNESRIKPDVVAPGTDIASTKSSSAPTSNFWGPYPKNRKYAFMGGTSMAAPIISGLAVLLRQYLRIHHNYEQPSAALLKALIINSTRALTSYDALADHDYIPNFHQGFGIPDLSNIIPTEDNENLKTLFLDTWQQPNLQFTSTGQRFLYSFKINEGTPLRLTFCWTDPPGRGLQNNLNVLLLNVATEQKFVGNEKIPRMITSFDRDNNVEIIRIDDPHGGEYRLAIQANNLLKAPQDFAVVISGHIVDKLNQIN